MEPKILAATLTTLAIIFLAMNGGMFNSQTVENTKQPGKKLLSSTSSNSLIPDIPIINKLTEKPEPKNNIKAVIQVKDNSKIKLKQSSLIAENLTHINASKLTITSDKKIKMKSYTGNLIFSNITSLNGKARGLSSNGVNVSSNINIDVKTNSQVIKVYETYRSPLKLTKASIRPYRNSSFGISTEDSTIKANSYSGDIVAYPENNTLIISGKVDQLTAGKYEMK